MLTPACKLLWIGTAWWYLSGRYCCLLRGPAVLLVPFPALALRGQREPGSLLVLLSPVPQVTEAPQSRFHYLMLSNFPAALGILELTLLHCHILDDFPFMCSPGLSFCPSPSNKRRFLI